VTPKDGEQASPSSQHSILSRAVGYIDRALDLALGATVALAALTVLAQVILRYLFNSPITWGDEFAVMVFAWTVFIGAAVVQRDDSHLSMDTFVHLLPPRAELVLYLVRIAAMAVVLGVLFVQGWVLAERFSGLRYPAMGISRGFLYWALPVCVPLIAYYLLRCLIRALRQAPDGR
jgi:TRAP-type C4-dicarboxylate transport system permease small subunit